ncbi:MAG: pilus assembly protein [Acidimicrobiia bacterium]|nr:pilus assembly protein [Acidimicrobiia bacterium]MCY4457239.1 pilus assembly protein [Acidimicrobiaceae bacterium]
MPNEPQDRECGAGLIGTSAALLVFLLMMLAAVQILFNLYATSLVTAAAYDAARQVASIDAASDRCAAVPAAEAAFVLALGDYGSARHARLQWTCNHPHTVTVRVIAKHPSVLPRRLLGLASLGNLDRTIEIRSEAKR